MQDPPSGQPPNAWHDRLAKKWSLKSKWDFWWIFFGFAVTGSLTSFITTRAVLFLHGEAWSWIALFATKITLLILVYPLVLLGVGLLIGQYSFYRRFLTKTWTKLTKNKS